MYWAHFIGNYPSLTLPSFEFGRIYFMDRGSDNSAQLPLHTERFYLGQTSVPLRCPARISARSTSRNRNRPRERRRSPASSTPPILRLVLPGSQQSPTFGTGLVRPRASPPPASSRNLAGPAYQFGIDAAPLLRLSLRPRSNLAVPLVPYGQPSSTMQVEVNGVLSVPLALPLTYANPSVFLNTISPQPIAVALNAGRYSEFGLESGRTRLDDFGVCKRAHA